MSRHRKNNLLPNITIGLLLLLVLALGGVFRWLDDTIRNGFTEVSSWTLTATDSVQNTWHDHWQNAEASAQLREANKEISLLKFQLQQSQALREQNESLRGLLHYRFSTAITSAHTTRILYRSNRRGHIHAWVRIPDDLIESMGHADLAPIALTSVSAVSPHGLAGRIVERQGPLARFVPLGAAGSAVDVVVGPGQHAIATGNDNLEYVQLEYVPRNSKVRVGDRVLTGGSDAIFPPGIPVGIVEKVTTPATGMYDKILVRLHQDGDWVKDVWLVQYALD